MKQLHAWCPQSSVPWLEDLVRMPSRTGSRDKGRHRQLAWESRYGPEEDLPHYDSGRSRDLDHRNGRGRLYRDDDDDYDYVYDDDRRSSRSREGRRRRDEEAGFRYRF